MPKEVATNPESGSEPHASLTLDDAMSLDFAESADDESETNGEEDKQKEQSKGETDETEEEGESEEENDEDESKDGSTDETDDEESEDDKESEADDDVTVTLKGGDRVTLEELKRGYMRERDYRRKTQDVGNRNRELETVAQNVVNSADAIVNYLVEMLPPKPDSALAYRDSGEYTRQMALYESSFNRLNELIRLANEPKKAVGELSEKRQREVLEMESRQLSEAFPETRKEEGRKKFFKETFETARDLGFSDEELQSVTDHRLFKLAYYARIGLAAEKAKKSVLKKVSEAPKPTAKVKQAQKPETIERQRNREAMKRLTKTGSIRDAMLIDFE